MGWIIGSIIVITILVLIILLKILRKDEHNLNEQKTTIPMPLNEQRGIQGERKVNHSLRLLLKEDEYLLNNILIPLSNGRTTEIDTLLITRKGIFCIEIKNWIGHIIGNDYSEFWIQKYDSPYILNKHRRNPVIQNEKHCNVLKRELKNQYDVYNIVIFPKIIDRKHLNSRHTYALSKFKKYYEAKDEILYPEDIEAVANKLLCYQATEKQMRAHKEQVKRDYRN